MPASTLSIPVTGTVRHIDGETQLVLSERIAGHDTFLSGTLEIASKSVPVRIITLDNVTVLRPLNPADAAGIQPAWTAKLGLPHGARPHAIPADLTTAAEQQHRALDALDEAELRYALTFLEEATTTAIRQSRIDAIVGALPRSAAQLTNPR
ncbi:hypothetical protein AB0M36_18420 [Actinoplanes sp. NPDC051346]|uniref:hypothetical protein n=1 Tax=Actinoplanes sp. NPDC051346 TaxID=3155048 RepID=UPI0034381FED